MENLMIDNMILIFAVDKNWGIGYKGDLLYKISEDLKRFRRLTTGNIIIMGRKTLESLPDQKSLPDRINIVLTREKNYKAEDVHVVNSLDELFSLIEELNPNNAMDNYVIGGGNIGKQLLPYSNKAYITKIDKAFVEADTTLPNLDNDNDWTILEESETYMQENVRYKYVDYIRVSQNY